MSKGVEPTHPLLAVVGQHKECRDSLLWLLAHTTVGKQGDIERVSPVLLRNVAMAWASLHGTTLAAVAPEALLRVRTKTTWYKLPNRFAARGLCRSLNHPPELSGACSGRFNGDVRFTMRCQNCGQRDYEHLIATWPTIESLRVRLDRIFYKEVEALFTRAWRVSVITQLTGPPGHWVQLAGIDGLMAKVTKVCPDPTLVKAIRRTKHKEVVIAALPELARNGYVRIPELENNFNFSPGSLPRFKTIILLPAALSLVRRILLKKPTFVLCAPGYAARDPKELVANLCCFSEISDALDNNVEVIAGWRANRRSAVFEFAAAIGKCAGCCMRSVGTEHFCLAADPELQRELAAESSEPWGGLADVADIVVEVGAKHGDFGTREAKGNGSGNDDAGVRGSAAVAWTVDGGPSSRCLGRGQEASEEVAEQGSGSEIDESEEAARKKQRCSATIS